ncbi:hypothetical protein B0H65DRAFT_474016 [Neurospora tetraspora]|uniref:Uncharacterized protein n=1 Tax=Neurospora tetraspora TaxID=94610 RepID=A0AAE0JC26_9PEZI|nr:hypothetical protein B0H65DRAFT_474016 [Neurospora tetraspora]
MRNSHTSPSSPNFCFLPLPVKRVPFPFASRQSKASSIKHLASPRRLARISPHLFPPSPTPKSDVRTLPWWLPSAAPAAGRALTAPVGQFNCASIDKVAWTHCKRRQDREGLRDHVTALTQGKKKSERVPLSPLNVLLAVGDFQRTRLFRCVTFSKSKSS